MMRFRVKHSTKFAYAELVPLCQNQVHLAPRQTATQHCSSFQLSVEPEPTECGRKRDYFGNRVDHFAIREAHQNLTVTATSDVNVASDSRTLKDAPPWEEIVNLFRARQKPELLDAYQFVFSSPHVDCSEDLAEFARQALAPGCSIVEGVTDLTATIHEQFEYDQHATTTHTQLNEVLANRRGVCQDFAHFEIGCLRSLGLAARYVSGYLRTTPPAGKPKLIGADASHAWLSVFCGESLGWVDFESDPDNRPHHRGLGTRLQ